MAREPLIDFRHLDHMNLRLDSGRASGQRTRAERPSPRQRLGVRQSSGAFSPSVLRLRQGFARVQVAPAVKAPEFQPPRLDARWRHEPQ